MDNNRRDFLKKASFLAGGAGLLHVLPASVAKAMAINPAPGSTFMDAEHIVFLMQENRSFDHTYGTLQGVRGFNDPRAITLPNNNAVWLQSNNKGETFAPFRLDIKNTKATWMSSLPHSWSNQVDARNNGRYDKWLDVKHSGARAYAAMPLTLGYYTREDIPFYYALADAFTVCDQHFCSSLTGTTPNRLYFWSGTIRDRQEAKAQANVWNEDADYTTMVSWKTFPERLEENDISWKVYQNELSVGVGFDGDEDAWLANFGDNPLEYFTQYKVRLSAAYIANLPKEANWLKTTIQRLEEELATAKEADAEKIRNKITNYKKQLATNGQNQLLYTKEKYDQLPEWQKNLHDKAFSTNLKDPSYHQLSTLQYQDGDTVREVKVPKGDVLYQFREDVQTGKLPTVSWIVAPEAFSDHPSSAWYGAWYISEVLDILTQNPEVWKKTIFILTYDENDGYFDHVPPFVPAHPTNRETGLASQGIDTGLEYVTDTDQQSDKKGARVSPIGLGYRVPLVIASPWSRGGWVNSEVFDHTSSLQFLEKFLAAKTKKKIKETNISEWRRTVCGDLSSVFRPYNGEKIATPEFLKRDIFIESIHKAKFKNPPSNFKQLSTEEIAQINQSPRSSALMAQQEKGIRSSCALPYELYAEAYLKEDKQSVVITLKAAKELFGETAAGSPFHVYAYGNYKKEGMQARAYTVAAGDTLQDSWLLADFENGQYHLAVYGPNGFFREFKGDENDPAIALKLIYERHKSNAKKLTGNVQLPFGNFTNKPQEIGLTDNAYKTGQKKIAITASRIKRDSGMIDIDLSKSYGWYDFTIRIKGNHSFEKRYAGRVETGLPGKTDPLMGNIL